ncbi:MAG: hypothetical protein ABIZ80_10655, partial [Bryobacteraceae bacterium]
WKRTIATNTVSVILGGQSNFNPIPVLDTARDIAMSARGDLYIADGRRVRALTSAGTALVVAGDGTFEFRGDGGNAAQARLNGPSGVAVDAEGALYIADERNQRIRKVLPSGTITSVAGTGALSSGVDGLAPTVTALAGPSGLAVDTAGVVLFTEYLGHRVRKFSPGSVLIPVAGTGRPGFDGDGGLATASALRFPSQVAVDAAGNVFVADAGNSRIRKITPGGALFSVAGSGVVGSTGDGSLATQAQLNNPRAIAVDTAGVLYIADTGNNRIRKVDTNGVITTVVGDSAGLNAPRGLALDIAGNLYIADSGNHRIRLRTTAGAVSVIAGSGKAGFNGDGGTALAADFDTPVAVAVDRGGNLYVADQNNHRIRKLVPASAPAGVDKPPESLLAPGVSVRNAASLSEGAVAPGEIISLFAPGIGPAAGVNGSYGAGGRMDTILGGVQVQFDGRDAPIFYVQENQANVQVPYSVADARTTQIEVLYRGVRKASFTAAVTRAAPGLFTFSGGTGPVIALNQDGSLNSRANPANRGSILTLFATGEGQLTPGGVEGRANTAPYPRPLLPVSMTIGGRPADILFAAAAPGYAGLLQVNARVPDAAPPGALVPIVLSAGSAASQEGVVIAIR